MSVPLISMGNRTFNGGSFFPFPARISAADPQQTAGKNKMILLLALQEKFLFNGVISKRCF